MSTPLGMANLPFTYAELQGAAEDKRVNKRAHPSLPYDIYNYADEVQYTNLWDDITRNCRGLIVDRDGNVVKRPWKKFFNLGHENMPIQFTDPVEVMDKVDGSLGILYPVPQAPTPSEKNFGFNGTSRREYAIATRGSFTSDQAYYATFKIWGEKYAEYYDDRAEQVYMDDYTLLFEIIYPKNRVVLNYHGMEDLVLLGAVETATGYYLSPVVAGNMFAWPGPVVETYEFNTITDAIAHMGRPNKEGYVIRSHNWLVKIKEPDYLDLHRLVTNLTAKTVWDKLKSGTPAEKIIASFPDEFHDDVKGLIIPLLEQFAKRSRQIAEKYITYVSSMDLPVKDEDYRKTFAHRVKKDKDARYMFAMLDNKSIADTLWTELRPREEPLDFNV